MILLNPLFIVGFKDQHGENHPKIPSDIAGAAYTRR